MILLDENVPESQRQLLLRQRIRARQIGVDVARKGIADEAIIPLLLELRRPSFFTRDMGFFDRTHCHRRYCLVCMAVGRDEAALFVRRFLRHPRFNTHDKRLGTVVRISRAGIRYWTKDADAESYVDWE